MFLFDVQVQCCSIVCCVSRLQVEATDETTKICAKCFENLSEYAKKRKICATTDRLMRNSQANDIDETSDVAARVDQLDADDAISVIDLTVLDSDSDAENDEVAADAEADQVRNSHPVDSEA